MKKCLLGSVALAILAAAGPAMAADMAVKAPAYKAAIAPPAFTWTGCYVGVNVGGVRNRAGGRYTDDPNGSNDPILGGTTFINSPANAIPVPSDTSSRSWIGGAQAGCNWQTDRFVLGIEGDWDAVNLSGTAGTQVLNGTFITSPIGGFVSAASPTGTATEQVSQHWIATFRARGGFTVADRLLVYVTGGVAAGSVTSSGTLSVTQTGGHTYSWAGTTSTTKTGYTVGAGAEWAFADHWSLKGEYLYYDLGNISHPLNLTACSVGPCFATLGNTTTRINGSIARVGLNYRF